jgi:hypothetical protein
METISKTFEINKRTGKVKEVDPLRGFPTSFLIKRSMDLKTSPSIKALILSEIKRRKTQSKK